MRSYLLSFPVRLHFIIVTGSTIALAFILAFICGMFFDAHQLKANADLISSVYQVMGTIYAILLTFTLWGVWQSYTEAEAAVQKEAYTMLDLVHIMEMTPNWRQLNIRHAALEYAELVINQEWATLKDITNDVINIRELNRTSCMNIVELVQSIVPEGEREVTIFSEALSLLTCWLDARRTRILVARGNSAKALWPLLITGAAVLFAFNGLFIAESLGIWITLLAGTSLVIGLTFYLIFTMDCPFSGSPSIDSEPFRLAIQLLNHQRMDEAVKNTVLITEKV